jgi:methylenetetrahydrofolate dehydrogenase (NADP+) / methenyltetrahydrofolate cyclohydrolase
LILERNLLFNKVRYSYSNLDWRKNLTAIIMDGNPVARTIRSMVRDGVVSLRKSNVQPTLVTIIVGNDPASQAYLNNKHAACTAAGIKSRNIELPRDTPQSELERIIQELNQDRTVTGILLQLPLPKPLNDAMAVASIAEEKDVDGLNPCNLGRLVTKDAKLVPCTPKGVIVLLKYYRVGIAGKHAVIINRSKLVGRPLTQLLLNEDATVTVCHSKTNDLSDISRQAEILLTGIGRRSEFTVGPDMIKPGAAVVDIGTSSVGGKLMGDVDFDNAIRVASFLTPVPGGVGPLTVSMLLYNSLVTASMQHNLEIGFNLDQLASPA